jgi:hypothetical protein
VRAYPLEYTSSTKPLHKLGAASKKLLAAAQEPLQSNLGCTHVATPFHLLTAKVEVVNNYTRG